MVRQERFELAHQIQAIALNLSCLPFRHFDIFTILSRLPFHNLLLLEHEALILVFRVPQSVQKVEFRDSLKPLRLFEQQKSLFKSYV